MVDLIISPVLAGLSVGIYCFSYCIPFIAPFMVINEQGRRDDILLIAKFILGRLIGYICFGALIGFLGQKIDSNIINLLLLISLMILSILMILHAAKIIKTEKFAFCGRRLQAGRRLPILMGFLMGINICPPFLMSISYVFTLQSVTGGIIYFLMFFLGTSVYFLPVFFLGYLNRIREFQIVGRISAVIVGIIFLAYSIYKIAGGVTNIQHL